MVNLTAVLWLGSLAIEKLVGLNPVLGCFLIAILSLAYSLGGGLKAVAMTDIIQVALLIFGGLAVSFIALNIISDSNGIFSGLSIVFQQAPEKFDMILSKDNPSYNNLPGIWILLGAGVWIGHFAYWGFNQYITQRALGAKSIKEAQKGVMFAAYLKLLMPFVIVLPGICAVILFPDLEKSDQAYPTMMTLLPNGLLGLTFAALIAAVISSIASMSNSVSTIYTMDIYRHFKNKKISDANLIYVGRFSVIVSLAIAVFIAPYLDSFPAIFQYIQEFTGLFTPGILIIFLVALFWKKATTLSVLVAAILSLLLSIFIKTAFPDFAFIHRMGVVFFLSGFGCFITAYLQGFSNQEKAIVLNNIDFKTSNSFNINALTILLILIITYSLLG